MFICGKKSSMSVFRISLLNKVGILSLMLMAYSGYIKWLPEFYIDPFFIFISIVLLNIFINYFNNNLNKKTLLITISLVSFFIFCLISVIWGTSNLYYIEKLQKLFVILICFITPFFLLRTKSKLFYFINIFHILCLIAATIIIIFFLIFGNIFILINQDSANVIKNIPDYLALGTLLSCGFILSLKNKSFLWILYKILIFIAIIILAPRGPLITLVLILITHSLLKYNFLFLLKRFISIILVGLFINFTLVGITDRLFSRLTNIFDKESTSYSSLDSRFELVNNAWDYFLHSPILGIGFGSFGKKYSGYDDRIEPHNIILEIISETGLLGLILFSFFIFFICKFIFKKFNPDDDLNMLLILLLFFLLLQSITSTYLIDSKDLFLWIGITLSYFSNNKLRININEYEK
jgi:O-antigen ligase